MSSSRARVETDDRVTATLRKTIALPPAGEEWSRPLVSRNSDALSCPGCGSADVIPLVFGYPTAVVEAQHSRGEVALGGCRSWGDQRDPRWSCQNCGLWWGGVVPILPHLTHLL